MKEDTASVKVQEEQIFAMAAEGKKDEAKQSLYDLVVSLAKSGQFAEAERLRERIYEIDPMALTEIIRSGEIIDKEKSSAVDDQDQHVWSTLADLCTEDEFSSLYHELVRQTLQAEEPIVTQGSRNDSLLFINKGSIKVFHKVGEKEIFITTLGEGDTIGENFFTPSTWTVSLSTLTDAEVLSITQEQVGRLEEKHAGISRKLEKFYNDNSNIPKTLISKGLERRQYKRFTLSRKIQVIPIHSSGKTTGKGFRAEIVDLSKGGLAFVIRISKKENTKLLLGRKLQVVLPVGGTPSYQYLPGRCISVQSFSAFESDYTVHIVFDNALDDEEMRNIVG